MENPFELPKNVPSELEKATREIVISRFRRWLWENIKLAQSKPDERVPLEEFEEAGYQIGKKFKNPTAGEVVGKLRELWELLQAGNKIRLLCWCAPLSCHADVIRNCLLEAESNPKLLALITSCNKAL